MGLLASIREYVDALVHPSAKQDTLTASRHRAFIAPRLLGSVVALAAFPVYVTARGVPSVLEVLVFTWLVAPILIAYFLSRTGQYESAHVLSSLALTGIVTAVALKTGGTGSFAAVWLVVVSLEAALSASRRVVALASTFALGAAALLMLMQTLALLPPPPPEHEHSALAALGIISAALYATGLALGAESFSRTNFWLLYAEEDRYRLLARNMTDIIARHGRNGTITFISPAAEPLFGAPIRTLTGHGLFDRIHVTDRPAYLTALAESATLGESRSVEFRVRRERAEPCNLAAELAGQFLWIELRCRALHQVDLPGARHEVVSVMREVTRRKEQEQALEQARSDAERANAAKSRFLATMSHELRTPLNAIIGFSEMLTNEASLGIGPERRHEYAKLINESGLHLLSVVNGILDMSKIETGNFEIAPEAFAPARVIADCCELLVLKANEAGIGIELKLPQNLPELVADKRSLTQIMINLVSNAIKFSNQGGKVIVSAKAEAAAMVVTVTDSGVGIGADDLRRVGDPFFQARSSYDRRHDGTGLGLSIVKGLVALHGGDIEIASRLGEGTRVTVRLPLDCGAARNLAAGTKIARLPSRAVEEPSNIRIKISA